MTAPGIARRVVQSGSTTQMSANRTPIIPAPASARNVLRPFERMRYISGRPVARAMIALVRTSLTRW